MANRFMLAPLTNCQSHEDGTLSDDELHWLQLRAKGGFGMVMTCATQVHPSGKGFPGQLALYDDIHEAGHLHLTRVIQSENSLAVVQLHHAGMRAPETLIHGTPLCPSVNKKTGARAMSPDEISMMTKAFIDSAIRAKHCGYDGVEVHGAHGYLVGQFLSSAINHREDNYGGSLTNRSRFLFEILNGIRDACGSEFLLGVRLSPERFGMQLEEICELTQQLVDSDLLDFIDLSLWDIYKAPADSEKENTSLLQHVLNVNYNDVRLTVAGHIQSGDDVQFTLDAGVDFATIGKAAILHHDFPKQLERDPHFRQISTPVSEDYLRKQGLNSTFIEYMRRWEGFVS